MSFGEIVNHPGTDFIRLIDKAQQETKHRSDASEEFESERERIGICLKALYDTSSCVFGCHGGNHTIEYLAGRAFNLGYAAYGLVRIGLYDEAFNQVRSLGELTNILALRVFDSTSFEAWLVATDDERLKKFKPVQIRILIEKAGGVIPVDKNLYSELCELATHISPKTVPNRHAEDQRPRVGGGFQKTGYERSLKELDKLLFCAATAFAKFTGQNELFEQIVALYEK